MEDTFDGLVFCSGVGGGINGGGGCCVVVVAMVMTPFVRVTPFARVAVVIVVKELLWS